MKFATALALGTLALTASAAPTTSNSNSNSNSNSKSASQTKYIAPAFSHAARGQRPSVSAHPHKPFKAFPTFPQRTKTCTVKSLGSGKDDSSNILSAFHSCNNGGHVIFSPNTTYTIGTAMDWTFLNSIDIDIQGTIKFTDNTTYWQANSFKYGFQNATSFFKLGGNDVFIYGGGELDGSGQAWYDLYAQDIYILRPVLIGIDGLKNSIISDLVLRYSPMYYHFVANASNVVFNNLDISGFSASANVAKNTDGWDTYRSEYVTIQSSVINNGDDCVSFKPNSTNMVVQDLWCNGSHGISVGSLGQYVGEYDIVENILVTDISMHNASDGARIKVWPNSPSALSGDLQGGGGDGRVNNVTYSNFLLDNVDYAIEVTQCYGQSNLTLCAEYPSPLTISNVNFYNFTGTTSTKYDPLIATLECSSATVCSNITATDINVLSPKGYHNATCLYMDDSKLNVTCTDVKLTL